MLFLTSPLFLFKQSSPPLPGTEVIVWDRLQSPLVNILFTTKLLSLDPLSWDMDCLLNLWPLLTPCSLGNGCCTFGFLIFIIVERNFLYNSLYTHRKIIKAPLLHQSLGPHVVFVSLPALPQANSLEHRHPSSSLSCPGFSDPLEKAPCAFIPWRGRLVPSWAMQARCQELYWLSA